MEKTIIGMDSTYQLCEGVQVRSEKFGLLFYHYAGPKLYFVRSNDLVDESFFSGKKKLSDLIGAIRERLGWSEKVIERQLSMLMRLLKSRGLVYEQPVC